MKKKRRKISTFALSKIYKCFPNCDIKKSKLFNHMIYRYIITDLVNEFIGYENMEASVM